MIAFSKSDIATWTRKTLSTVLKQKLTETGIQMKWFETKSWYESNFIRKLKHANSIIKYFEYFCQTSSKSILIILGYTVQKFARFFSETQCSTKIISVHIVCDFGFLLLMLLMLDCMTKEPTRHGLDRVIWVAGELTKLSWTTETRWHYH